MQVYTTLYSMVNGRISFLIGKKKDYADYLLSNPDPQKRFITEDLYRALSDKGEDLRGIKHSKKKILIKNGPNSWCFIGGRAQDTELLQEAAKREFAEETGVELDEFGRNTTVFVMYPNNRTYICNYLDYIYYVDYRSAQYVVFFDYKTTGQITDLYNRIATNLNLSPLEKIMRVKDALSAFLRKTA